MTSVFTDIDFNLKVELNLEDSQFLKLYDAYGPDFDSELEEHLKRYIQGSLVSMLENVRVDDEFMIAMQLEPNIRDLSRVAIGINHLYR